jgi:CBS-domain-containing membrane protein
MTSILSNTNNLTASRKDTLQHFIESKTVGDVLNSVKPTSRELLDLPLESTMEEAFDLLLAHNILSVPIYYLEGDQKHYVAIVSALDLLKLLSSKVTLPSCNGRENFGILITLYRFHWRLCRLTVIYS